MLQTAAEVMRKWLKTATKLQAAELAKVAETSVPHLRHIAAGRRDMSAALAQRLAHASQEVGILLDQRELCAACAKCELAKPYIPLDHEN